MRLRGDFQLLFLYDVAEAFDQKRLGELLGPRAAPARHALPRRTPDYVRFENAPIVERGEPLTLGTGEQVICSIKYYSFAVVAVEIGVSFDCDWASLLAQNSRWMDDETISQHAQEIARRHLEVVAPAVIRPNQDWLHETYMVIKCEGDL